MLKTFKKKVLDFWIFTSYICSIILKPIFMKTLDFTILPYNGICENELRNHIMKKEKEYIEKQEILDAIREGLLEIKKRRESGSDGVTLQQLIDEL